MNLFTDKSEHSEQAIFCQYLDIKRIPYFAIPNGIFLKDKVSAFKIIAKQKKEGLKSGVPDLFICRASGKYNGLFIEMKKVSGGTASKKQKDWIEVLRKEGYKAEICRGHREAINCFDEYIKGE